MKHSSDGKLGRMLTGLVIGSFSAITLVCCLAMVLLYSRISEHYSEVLGQSTVINSGKMMEDRYLKACSLTALCSGISDLDILPQTSTPLTVSEKKVMISVYNQIAGYVDASSVGAYVIKASFFRNDGLMIQYNSQALNSWIQIDEWKMFQKGSAHLAAESAGNRMIFGMFPASRGDGNNLFCLYPIYDSISHQKEGYAVCEFIPQLFTDCMPQMDTLTCYLTDMHGNWLVSAVADQQWSVVQSNEVEVAYQRGDLQKQSSLWLETDLEQSGMKLFGAAQTNGSDPHHLLLIGMLLLILLFGFILAILLSHIFRTKVKEPIYTIRDGLMKVPKHKNSNILNPSDLPGDFAMIGTEINRMNVQIEELLEKSVQDAQKAKDYEIAALQSQINPHFIYNTLDSIRWMADLQKNEGVAQMSDALSHLLRSMADHPGDKIPLSKELELLQNYITIQSIRYLDSFEFRCEVPEECLTCRIVKFTLQPLTENAIFHGVEPSGKYCSITLSARIEEESLRLVIEDNGVGMTADQVDALNCGAEELHGHIGAKNVRERLKLVYGESYGLKYESTPGAGTRAIVVIPRE